MKVFDSNGDLDFDQLEEDELCEVVEERIRNIVGPMVGQKISDELLRKIAKAGAHVIFVIELEQAGYTRAKAEEMVSRLGQPMTDEELYTAAQVLRRRAAKVGSMSALWDLIFDAEAHATHHIGDSMIADRAEVERLVNEAL